MRRLLPEPADDVTVDTAYGAPLGALDGRPWVGMCMIASIDGSTVVDGTSAKLSSPTDIAVLTRLRRLADVIVVGAQTVRDEGYGAPDKPGQRIGVVTASGELDYASELFSSGSGFLITSGSARLSVPEHVDVLRTGSDHIDFDAVIRALPSLIEPCRFVQVEGGAALNGALFAADMIDEINLTTSAATFGGDGPRLAHGAPPHAHRFEVVQLAIDEQSYVYTRWLRRRD
jgi:riboflavin biosynthesis pyrimidine reductase